MTTTEQPSAPPITDREAEVLTAISYGWSNRQVADRLYVSENTVKSHVRRVSRRWNIHTRVGLVSFALRNGVIK